MSMAWLISVWEQQTGFPQKAKIWSIPCWRTQQVPLLKLYSFTILQKKKKKKKPSVATCHKIRPSEIWVNVLKKYVFYKKAMMVYNGWPCDKVSKNIKLIQGISLVMIGLKLTWPIFKLHLDIIQIQLQTMLGEDWIKTIWISVRTTRWMFKMH